jgi:hypothetical protein
MRRREAVRGGGGEEVAEEEEALDVRRRFALFGEREAIDERN